MREMSKEKHLGSVNLLPCLLVYPWKRKGEHTRADLRPPTFSTAPNTDLKPMTAFALLKVTSFTGTLLGTICTFLYWLYYLCSNTKVTLCFDHFVGTYLRQEECTERYTLPKMEGTSMHPPRTCQYRPHRFGSLLTARRVTPPPPDARRSTGAPSMRYLTFGQSVDDVVDGAHIDFDIGIKGGFLAGWIFCTVTLVIGIALTIVLAKMAVEPCGVKSSVVTVVMMITASATLSASLSFLQLMEFDLDLEIGRVAIDSLIAQDMIPKIKAQPQCGWGCVVNFLGVFMWILGLGSLIVAMATGAYVASTDKSSNVPDQPAQAAKPSAVDMAADVAAVPGSSV